jgi:hypothetical protein
VAVGALRRLGHADEAAGAVGRADDRDAKIS